MAILPILRYPDPRLHQVAARVARVDDKIRNLIKDMADTMYAAPGIGLAATQVDVHQRVIVIDISEARDQLQVFVNPELLEAAGEAECEEGCLSVPGIFENVRRAQRIKVRAWDATGENRTLEKYYAPFLDLASFMTGETHRWPAEQRVNVEALARDRLQTPYASPAGEGRIVTSVDRRVFWIVVVVVAILLCAGARFAHRAAARAASARGCSE